MHQVLPPTGLAYSVGVPASTCPLAPEVRPALTALSSFVAASRLVRACTASARSAMGTSEAAMIESALRVP